MAEASPTVSAGMLLPARISIIVPCYNEAENVVPLVAALDAALEGERWEV